MGFQARVRADGVDSHGLEAHATLKIELFLFPSCFSAVFCSRLEYAQCQGEEQSIA